MVNEAANEDDTETGQGGDTERRRRSVNKDLLHLPDQKKSNKKVAKMASNNNALHPINVDWSSADKLIDLWNYFCC